MIGWGAKKGPGFQQHCFNWKEDLQKVSLSPEKVQNNCVRADSPDPLKMKFNHFLRDRFLYFKVPQQLLVRKANLFRPKLQNCFRLKLRIFMEGCICGEPQQVLILGSLQVLEIASGRVAVSNVRAGVALEKR